MKKDNFEVQAINFNYNELNHIEKVSQDVLDICGKGLTDEQIHKLKKQIDFCEKMKAKIREKR